MNEKEKMLSGNLYNPLLGGLQEEHLRARELCRKYNSEFDPKYLKELLGKTGKQYHIETNFFCDYGYNIEIGENFFSNYNLVILDPARVTFGDNVFIGPNCGFYTPEHPLDAKTRNKGLEYAKPIKVGNNVWFGGGVTVMGGVTIGDNVVIGAGSVVVKDIPSNVVVAGNPCRVLKRV